MITIDGSHNEGGGQILRLRWGRVSQLGRRFGLRISGPGAKTVGLLRQLLVAVMAAARIGKAESSGAGSLSRERKEILYD